MKNAAPAIIGYSKLYSITFGQFTRYTQGLPVTSNPAENGITHPNEIHRAPPNTPAVIDNR